MTAQSWHAGRRTEEFELPDSPPPHLVDELVQIIELSDDAYPSTEQWSAVKRLAQAVREETGK